MKNNSGKLAKAQIATILFDLDGTIIDTEPSAAQAVRESFQSWKIEIKADDSAFVTGRTWATAFEFLFQKYSLPIPQTQAIEQIMAAYRDKLENSLCVVPGSVQCIQSLATRYPLGLVSGSGRTEILWALRKLKIDQHFKIILGAEDYPRSKPQPDGYLKAMGILQSTPDTCLVFEDSTAGVASGRAAGMWVAAITSTNHFQQDTSHAHFKITDLSGVNADWVTNLSVD
jgi:HAD superfamily hydrolase (TIGR01509 family)